jgi:hypothetical protein
LGRGDGVGLGDLLGLGLVLGVGLVLGDGSVGDGLRLGDGLPGDGLPGDGLPGDGLPGDGLPGDGLPGDGLWLGDGLALGAGLVLAAALRWRLAARCPDLVVDVSRVLDSEFVLAITEGGTPQDFRLWGGTSRAPAEVRPKVLNEKIAIPANAVSASDPVRRAFIDTAAPRRTSPRGLSRSPWSSQYACSG